MVFLNFEGAHESIIKNRFRQPMLPGVAGQYDNPIPSLFLAPIDCSKIPALNVLLS